MKNIIKELEKKRNREIMNKKYAVLVDDNREAGLYKILYDCNSKEEARKFYLATRNKKEPVELIEYTVIRSKFKRKV